MDQGPEISGQSERQQADGLRLLGHGLVHRWIDFGSRGLSGADRRLVRRYNAMVLCGAATTALFSCVFAAVGSLASSSATAVMTGLIVGLWRWALAGSVRRVRGVLHASIGVSILVIAALAYATGSWRSGALFIVAIPLLAAAHTLGVRALLGWTAVTQIVITATFVAGVLVPIPGVGEDPVLAWFVRLFTFNLGVCLLALSARNVADRSYSELEALNLSLESRVEARTDAWMSEMVERERVEHERAELSTRYEHASKAAGMADTATGVLHNVGNVLNGATVSVSLLLQRRSSSTSQRFDRALGLLTEHPDDLPRFLRDDPKGQKVLLYLERLAQKLRDEEAAVGAELRKLARSLDHIKQIIGAQQTMAKSPTGAVCRMSIYALVDDAIEFNLGSSTGYDVERVHEADDLPEILVEPHAILQILVNYIGNAKQAIRDAATGKAGITIRIARCGPEDDPQVEVSVTDTGIGIAPESQAQLFERGFTTKPDGHGFGLYSAAEAARRIAGEVGAHSPGVGQGATFWLRFPLRT